MSTVWRCLLALVVIWLVAAGAMVAVQWARSTPQKFMTYVNEHPLQGLDAAKREAIIDQAAKLLNGLSSSQRQEVKKNGTLKTFYTQLTQEERRRFLELTLPDGFRQMIATLNEMDSPQRKKVVQRTLRDMQNSEVSELGDESDIETMFSEGSSIFNEKASPEVKLDFEPVIKEVLRRKELATKKAQNPIPR